MLAARIHSYQKPLVLDKIEKPKIEHDNQVLLRVGATGLCHSDFHKTFEQRWMPCHCWAIRKKYKGTARTICNTNTNTKYIVLFGEITMNYAK